MNQAPQISPLDLEDFALDFFPSGTCNYTTFKKPLRNRTKMTLARSLYKAPEKKSHSPNLFSKKGTGKDSPPAKNESSDRSSPQVGHCPHKTFHTGKD